MATKPTAKKQPFIIEPLNWVAPDVSDDESEKRTDDAKQSSSAKENKA